MLLPHLDLPGMMKCYALSSTEEATKSLRHADRILNPQISERSLTRRKEQTVEIEWLGRDTVSPISNHKTFTLCSQLSLRH